VQETSQVKRDLRHRPTNRRWARAQCTDQPVRGGTEIARLICRSRDQTTRNHVSPAIMHSTRQKASGRTNQINTNKKTNQTTTHQPGKAKPNQRNQHQLETNQIETKQTSNKNKTVRFQTYRSAGTNRLKRKAKATPGGDATT